MIARITSADPTERPGFIVWGVDYLDGETILLSKLIALDLLATKDEILKAIVEAGKDSRKALDTADGFKVTLPVGTEIDISKFNPSK